MLSLIVVLPFLSALFLGGLYLSRPQLQNSFIYTAVGIASPAISAILSFVVLLRMFADGNTVYETLFQWIDIGSFQIAVAFMADRLSVVMISFITLIGTLIHIYAAGYMRGDPGYGKFFSYFNLFMGSMLLLVLADNPVMMFVGWELVGLSSYLLIGFYHQDHANITAANKAFILNRVGDFGFIIAIALLFVSLEGSGFTFDAIAANISTLSTERLTLIGLLLFVGAMGKSAQIPLYVWLPDAMAGPTPVSALIHAATMVTAGVYMVARYSFLYVEIPDVGLFIAYIGAASALFAALMATFESDIKKILAYSTMSQLGYMFIAVGLGAYSSGIFHVFTHAFFKALLFMGAGAVIIALHHEQNIFKMGALKKALPVVYVSMFIATLAISGIPPFAGFFSKDAILMAAFSSEHYDIWAVGLFTAFLTAFYMFRLFFSVFLAEGSKERTLQELPGSMTRPLLFLALGSATVGFLGLNEAFGGHSWFQNFLSLPDVVHEVSHTQEYMLVALSVTVALMGMGLAYRMFAHHPQEAKSDQWLKTLIINKFYVDELYDVMVVKPLLLLSRLIATVIDPKIVDALIMGLSKSYLLMGRSFARLQTGRVGDYALQILIGVSLMSTYILFKLGMM